MSSRRRPRSPVAAPPLEDDDLLSEILLRLPPTPSSLPRASLVSKRWLGLVSDPGFSRRFCLHHRRNPPLLGLFNRLHFIPTMEPPNRVPRHRFSLQLDDGRDARFLLLGCRHGLVLILHASRRQILVWDPVTGGQNILALPPGLDKKGIPIHGTVLRAAADVHHFQVVLLGTETSKQQHTRAITRVYSSDTGIWGDLMSTPLLPKASSSVIQLPPMINDLFPGVLVGDSLYWLLSGSTAGILEFDLDRQSLSVIDVPVDIYARRSCHFTVMRADDGGLGFLSLSKKPAQLWKRKIDSDGVASWVLGTTFEIDKLFSLNSVKWRGVLMILGFAEDNNVVFLSTLTSLFMLQLESLQLKKLFDLKSYVAIIHSKVSMLQARALVVDMVDLNFCTIHRMIGQIDMLP